jgi:endonuclease/exonuclease/phosphatase family metal-dependent hydrolase
MGENTAKFAWQQLPKTYSAMLPCLAMDRIYYRGFRMITADIKTNSAWDRISGHCAVAAELQLLE